MCVNAAFTSGGTDDGRAWNGSHGNDSQEFMSADEMDV